MKICVFGADGRTGVEVVIQCLEQKHQVIAFVYNPKAQEYLPKEVDIIIGNVLIRDDVEKAMKGCDAVVSVVGHVKGSDPFMQTKGMRNITKVMKENNISRIISLTGTGVRIVGDTPSLFDRIGNLIIKLIDRERIVDGMQHAQVLKKSGLDWTILRVLKLSNGDFAENKNPSLDTCYLLTQHGPAESFTSRKKVAKIMTDLVASDKYIQEMPVSSRF
jgi:putative NADH-flavin reductase